jgi:hypothetical protein
MATIIEEPEIGTFVVTCLTDNCDNKDIEITVQASIPAVVYCGGCMMQITNIQTVNLNLETTQE